MGLTSKKKARVSGKKVGDQYALLRKNPIPPLAYKLLDKGKEVYL